MKKLILIALLGAAVQGNAQNWRFGIKGSCGTGWVNSQNLQSNLDAVKTADPAIRSYEKTFTPGLAFGFGASTLFSLSYRIGVQADFTFNSLSSRFDIRSERNTVAGGNGEISNIESQLEMRSWYFSLPVMLRYAPFDKFDKYGPFLLAGAKMDFLRIPRIESSESKTTITYSNGVASAPVSSSLDASATADMFATTRFSAAFGVGYAIDIKGRVLAFDVRYYLPITASPLYTYNKEFAEEAYDNKVFSQNGKTVTESYSPDSRLEDFKMTTIEASVTFFLFQRSAASCFQAAKRCW